MGASPKSPHAGAQQKYALQCYASEDTKQDMATSSSQWTLLSQFE